MKTIQKLQLLSSNKENFTARLPPLSFHPVSVKEDTSNGHTPTLLKTTSTNCGIDNSMVIKTFVIAGREAIQTRVPALLRRLSTNSFIEKRFWFLITFAAVLRRRRLKRRRSKTVYSPNFKRYPLIMQLLTTSTSNCGPPCTETIETMESSALRILTHTVVWNVVLLLKRMGTATQLWRNAALSHVRMNKQVRARPCYNSTMHTLHSL